MPQPYLSFGPFSFYFYGLFIGLGVLVIYFYTRRYAGQFLLDNKGVENLFFVSLFSALVGARLYHVISWYSYYRQFPLEIFYIWHGGLGIFGVILGAILGIYFYCKKNRMDFLNVLNLFAPPLLLAQAIGRLGNYFNLEGFGPPTESILRVFVPVSLRPVQFLGNSYFHPTFFYEALLCLFFFLLYILFFKRKNLQHYGLAYYLISYGLIRLFTEMYRIDTWKYLDYKVGYIISFIMIFAGTGIVYFLKRKK